MTFDDDVQYVRSYLKNVDSIKCKPKNNHFYCKIKYFDRNIPSQFIDVLSEEDITFNNKPPYQCIMDTIFSKIKQKKTIHLVDLTPKDVEEIKISDVLHRFIYCDGQKYLGANRTFPPRRKT